MRGWEPGRFVQSCGKCPWGDPQRGPEGVRGILEGFGVSAQLRLALKVCLEGGLWGWLQQQ